MVFLKHVIVSSKIDVELSKKLTELDIKPPEAIRKALEKEVGERMRQQLYRKVEEASEIIKKVNKEVWVKTIRKSKEKR